MQKDEIQRRANLITNASLEQVAKAMVWCLMLRKTTSVELTPRSLKIRKILIECQQCKNNIGFVNTFYSRLMARRHRRLESSAVGSVLLR
jgi:hypothetical protein